MGWTIIKGGFICEMGKLVVRGGGRSAHCEYAR